MLTSPGGAIVCSLCVSEGYILNFQHLGVHLTVYNQAAGWLVTFGKYILINLFTNILQNLTSIQVYKTVLHSLAMTTIHIHSLCCKCALVCE